MSHVWDITYIESIVCSCSNHDTWEQAVALVDCPIAHPYKVQIRSQCKYCRAKKSETMTDPAMARLMLEGPKELKAITVNGQIIVETDDDRER